MREIRLHDTRSGAVQRLQPRDSGRIGIYACGPTVYSRIHIGNARPFVLFSLLKRFLAHEGYDVTLVVNITDVNDKIYDAARARAQQASTGQPDGPQTAPRKINSEELAAEMTRLYVQDTDALGLGRPDHEPLASQTMAEIVSYIQVLIESGHAYASGGDVFFDVRSEPSYGVLSHRKLDHMDQGEDGLGSHPPADRKRHALDFALWKARKEGEDTFWDPRDHLRADSVDPEWHAGRPGWHIECSAMAESLLGVGFDIHGGGSDLVFPHHENEAAQTRAARGRELAKLWMHNGMIQATGEKMAKSVGNIAPLHEAIDRYGRDAVVMYLISGHYRQPLAFSEAELHDAERRIVRIREAMRRLLRGEPSPADMAHHREAFFDALAEDFNTPRALASLFEWVREANRAERSIGDADLREMLDVLGLGTLEPLAGVDDLSTIDQEARRLAQEREQARCERDFARADTLREQIRAQGWEVRDGPEGPELIPIAVER